ncbi:MAG: porin, partial [Gemmatimonadaceae bacterium]
MASIATCCWSAQALAQDTTRATPPAAAPAPTPTYLLNPSPVINMRFYPSKPALSGYVSGRMTHVDGATGFLLNRGRLTVQVGPKPFFGIKIQGDFSGAQTGKLRADSTVAGFSLTDAYVQLAPPPAWAPAGSMLAQLHPAIVAGQFKTLYSLEYVTSFASLKTVDRSQVVDRLSQKRDIGAMAQVGWGRFATLSGAVVNGEGPNATSNADKSQMLLSRLTIMPVSFLALSAKVAREGADHAWGYDGRIVWRALTVEGEGLYRKRPTSSTVNLDAGGGYALIAYKILPWLEPVYKYDRYWDTRTTNTGSALTTASTHSTWNVFGVNLLSSPEWLRLQLDWERRNVEPT